jgi:molybdate transport system substrate-binding protein
MKFAATILSALMLSCMAHGEITVFAASSLTDVMKAMAEAYGKVNGETVRFNFAGTGTLARQIEAGAPADLFIAANVKWMDLLEEKKAVASGSRFNLAGNRLVLVAPLGSTLGLDAKVEGRIAVGDFKSVPAGMYAEEALEHMQWLEAWKPKLVMTSNVRSALLYAERGEVDAAIVYVTDVAMSSKLRVVGTFPIDSHSPIVYPVAACSESESALGFLNFLKSPEAHAILKAHGFTDPAE